MYIRTASQLLLRSTEHLKPSQQYKRRDHLKDYKCRMTTKRNLTKSAKDNKNNMNQKTTCINLWRV